MEQKIVKRRLVVGAEVESYLAKVFGCSYRMIKKAMYLSEKSDLARRIQKAAREKGAYVELSAPSVTHSILVMGKWCRYLAMAQSSKLLCRQDIASLLITTRS